MALERDFVDMCGDKRVTITPLSTMSAYAVAEYSTDVQRYPAHIEPGNRLVRTLEGEEVVSTAMVFVMSSSATLGMKDKLTLPSGATPVLYRVDVMEDEEGQHHLEVYI